MFRRRATPVKHSASPITTEQKQEEICNYCRSRKLKTDASANYGRGKCACCGAKMMTPEIQTQTAVRPTIIAAPEHICGGVDDNRSSGGIENISSLEVPSVNKLLEPLHCIILSEAEARGVVLGGTDSTRTTEIQAFWLKWYGHPPEGKGGWGKQGHRLFAYDNRGAGNPTGEKSESACDSRAEEATAKTPRAMVVGGIQWQNPKTAKIEGTKGGYISALAVHGGHRGRGIAKLLMAAAVEQIRRDGATSSHLVVTQYGIKETPHLDAFYAALGFEHALTRGLKPKSSCPEEAKVALPGNSEKPDDDSLPSVGVHKQGKKSAPGDILPVSTPPPPPPPPPLPGGTLVAAQDGQSDPKCPKPKAGLFELRSIPHDYAARVLLSGAPGVSSTNGEAASSSFDNKKF